MSKRALARVRGGVASGDDAHSGWVSRSFQQGEQTGVGTCARRWQGVLRRRAERDRDASVSGVAFELALQCFVGVDHFDDQASHISLGVFAHHIAPLGGFEEPFPILA